MWGKRFRLLTLTATGSWFTTCLTVYCVTADVDGMDSSLRDALSASRAITYESCHFTSYTRKHFGQRYCP
jgi:hypothetical protein